METLLEQQRRLHEEKERLYEAMAKESMHKNTSLREQINSDHRMKHLMDRIMDNAIQLQELYEDKDGLRKEEIKAIAGPNEFNEFYKRLREIKTFHTNHPNEVFVPMSMEFEELNQARENSSEEANLAIDFTDEESFGRFLDLHSVHMLFLNLKGVEKCSYVRYLDIFDRLFEIPREKKNAQYREYLDQLLGYLVSFTQRTKPLLDLQKEFDDSVKKFEGQWKANDFPGWGKEAGSAMAHSGAYLDLSAFSSPEELASLGLDRLKSALMALNLKCGGSLDQRANRLFSTKGKSSDEIDSSLFAKTKGPKGAKKGTSQKGKDIANVEAQIYHLVELLSEQRAATRDNVQRRQARTDTERDEDDEDVMSDSDSGDEEEEIIYNPKNLPLGWDGKPIPYWLYKLHGLNINYNCEICGNQTYRGPKSFQRHFSEWRHAHGMRCLGIPNTAHFANVTRIEDAMALWSKIKEMKNSERWNPDQEEEYEDSAGNVVSKKTYEDLKRQGLL